MDRDDTVQLDTSTNSPSLTRRDFIGKATLGSALAITAPRLAEAEPKMPAKDDSTLIPKFARLYSLAPGAVTPQGWLRFYLDKQAKNLTSKLPTVSWPFTEAFWSGQEDTGGHQWWGWEQKGYWIDGALRCALVLKDESLLRQASDPIDYTLNHITPEGYIGPMYLRDAKDPKVSDFAPNEMRWPHHVFFRALTAHAEATGDKSVAVAMRRHYLGDDPAMYEGSSRNLVNIEEMLWTYLHTGDPALLAMSQKIWDSFVFRFPPGDRVSGDLHPERVLARTRIRAHGVSYAERSKLPAILYMHTGDKKYLHYAVAAQERIFTHHMLIDGIPSCAEEFSGIEALNAHETCDITDLSWSWGYLLMATGDGVWADRIERACLNAGFGAIKKDWKALQYFSSPNQVLATKDSSHVPYGYGSLSLGWMAFRPSPGHETACCTGNVHRLWPNFAIRMWMRDPHGGLAAAFYGPSSVRAEVGAERVPVEIHEETDYPFGEDIQLTIRSERAVSFPLSLRIPGWCKSPQLLLNGAPLTFPEVNNGFVRIERTYRPGDRITLKLPMHTKVSFWPQTWAYTGMGFEYGPLVYALRIDESWSSSVDPKYSTAELPEWEVTPASTWNYGMAITADAEKDVLGKVRVERGAMTEDPWVNPPVRLVVPMKVISKWQLRAENDRQRTPPLPGPEEKSEREEVQVPLVPYGSTHVRVTIFPQVWHEVDV